MVRLALVPPPFDSVHCSACRTEGDVERVSRVRLVYGNCPRDSTVRSFTARAPRLRIYDKAFRTTPHHPKTDNNKSDSRVSDRGVAKSGFGRIDVRFCSAGVY